MENLKKENRKITKERFEKLCDAANLEKIPSMIWSLMVEGLVNPQNEITTKGLDLIGEEKA